MTADAEGRDESVATLVSLWSENAAARSELRDAVHGLSEGQLAFQPVLGGWSIGEILDHLCLAERAMTRSISRLLQQAAGLGQIGDQETMQMPVGRIDLHRYNQPAGAPESVLPSPNRPLERLLTGLAESRERLLEVTKRIEGRVVGPITLPHFQLGELNFYQWLAVQAAHERKHLTQIQRVKADPAFPRQ